MCLCSPPDPHQDACSWILSESNRPNFALISALPSHGIRQIRIHWLLNAVTVHLQSVLNIIVLCSKFVTALYDCVLIFTSVVTCDY